MKKLVITLGVSMAFLTTPLAKAECEHILVECNDMLIKCDGVINALEDENAKLIQMIDTYKDEVLEQRESIPWSSIMSTAGISIAIGVLLGVAVK